MDEPARCPEPLAVGGRIRRGDFTLDVDISVEPGQCVGLWGDIGSGKSSVLDLLAGELSLVAGSLTWGEAVWDGSSGDTEQERPAAALHQRFTTDLSEDLTGVENVIHRFPGSADEADARDRLRQLGVGDHVVERLPWTFSGAEAQRIALATVFASRRPLLLLDEPFSALDKRTGQLARGVVEQWVKESTATVLVAGTHREHLSEVCDRIVDI